MFAAGAGVLYLLRTLGWPDRPAADDGRGRAPAVAPSWWDAGMVVAALAYALSPYVLDYAARISVILLPWAGLPWLIALLARAIRVGGWRYPAAFALVTLTISSTNLTSVVLVGIGPILWVVFVVWIDREAHWRQAMGAVWRTGLLTVGVSLWWFVGLVVEGRYGIPIVRYTETYQAVAVASTTPEVRARARLLVLLRQRQARPVDRPQHPLHAVRHPDLASPCRCSPSSRPPWSASGTACSSSP